MQAVLMVRSEPTAEASLAAIFDRSKFGIAIAAIIKIIATTIRSSISEKPFCWRRMWFSLRIRTSSIPFRRFLRRVTRMGDPRAFAAAGTANCGTIYKFNDAKDLDAAARSAITTPYLAAHKTHWDFSLMHRPRSPDYLRGLYAAEN